MKKIAFMLMIAMLMLTVPVFAETVTPTDTPTDAPTVAADTQATPDALLQQWYDIGAQLRANGNYPFTELSKGDKGFEVKALQTRLAELGYYEKAVVEKFGGGTYSALRAFEKANDLKVNGIASVEDQKVLYSSTAVEYTGKKVASSSNKQNNEADATSGATSN